MYYLYEHYIFRAYFERAYFFQRVLKGHLQEIHIILSRLRQTIVLLNQRFNKTKLQYYNLSSKRKI